MASDFTVENFEDEVLKSEQVVLIDFWSEGWPPCRALGPVIDELSAELEGQAKIGKVNIGDHFDLAAKYGITGVPTVAVFKGGELVSRKLGALSKEVMKTMIAEHS